MEKLAIAGVVIMYLLIIAFQHLLNWGYRQDNKDFPIPLVILGQLFSLVLLFGLTMSVIKAF
tara:strand:- start:1139 stop:1324 length:186 start_codon:yes stop_codon:yes gene_type:complete